MAVLSRLALATVLTIPVLSACGGSGESFAPACPRPSILRDADDLFRYRAGGRDLTDLVVQGRITGLGGDCKRDGSRVVVVSVSVGMDLTRGPAATSRFADVAYFVAVTDGDKVLDKQVFPLRAEFPENTDRVRLSGEDVELRLPVTEKKSAAAYQITVGFQLTPAELEINRRRISNLR